MRIRKLWFVVALAILIFTVIGLLSFDSCYTSRRAGNPAIQETQEKAVEDREGFISSPEPPTAGGNHPLSATGESGEKSQIRKSAPFISNSQQQLLEDVMAEKPIEERIEALRSLVEPEPPEPVRRVIFDLLGDKDPQMRLEAVFAFQVMRDPDGVPILETMARRDPSQTVRSTAASMAADLQQELEPPR